MKAPLSLEAFDDWLVTMPAEGTYDYMWCHGCAWYKYLKFLGVPVLSVSPSHWRSEDDPSKTRPLPDGVDQVVADGDWTFGAAHARARELLARR